MCHIHFSLSLMSFLRLVCSGELFLCFISKCPHFYGFLVEMSDWMIVIFTSGETWLGLWFLMSSFHRARTATVLRCPTLLGGNCQWDLRYQRGTSQLCGYGLLVSCTDELCSHGRKVCSKQNQVKEMKISTRWDLLVCLSRYSSGQCRNGWWTEMRLGTSWSTQQFVAPFPQRVETQRWLAYLKC